MAIVITTLAGCASMNVSSHVRQGVDFSRYRTYDWGPADALPTGDARLDRDPFFQDHVQGEVEKQLAAKGFERASAAGSADLLIHYHASINRRIDVNRVDRGYGYCYDDNCDARVVEYEAGTLVVDIVDRQTDRVVWRGWAQRSIADALADEDKMGSLIARAVKQMMERLPRGPVMDSARSQP